MKAMKYSSIILIVAMLLALVPAGSVSAAAIKVDVCHLDDMGVFHLINISENAFPAHVEHGDASPGDWVPGMPGYKFSSTCTTELDLNVTGTWSGKSGVVGNLNYTFNMILDQDDTGAVTGTITYPNYATRDVSGNLVGNTLTITTADVSYSATVTGTTTGVYFYGTGIDSNGVNVALAATKQ